MQQQVARFRRTSGRQGKLCNPDVGVAALLGLRQVGGDSFQLGDFIGWIGHG